ncbi:MAG TPA: VWA domain-containing protein [Vicinamibacterales bacterium]|nr:VWA domain-containing protein [Vicinamibacterales bacterium]
MKRPAVAALLGFLATAAPSAQQQVFKSGIDVTTIDVTVVGRNGDPIRELTAGDFAVTVDGKARAIVSAQFVSFSDEAAAGIPPAAPDPREFSSNENHARGRLMVLLVDQGNIRLGEERSVLRAAEGFLDRLTPSDRVSLLTIPAGPVIAFTGDAARIKEGLRRIRGQYQLPISRHNISATESLLIEDGDADTLAAVIRRECRGDPACPQEIEQEARSIAPAVRSRGLDTVRALSDVFAYLKTIDGPKTVAMISEGLILDQQRFPAGLPPEVEKLASQARAMVYVLRLGQDGTDASTPSAFRQVDLAAQTIGLETVAGATGGDLFTVVGTGAAMFSRMTRELSGEYLLGIETIESDRDGRQHRIKVSVKRGAVQVRSRRTFEADAVAPRPGEASAAAAIVNALRTPLLVSALPVRATSYVLMAADRSKVRVVIAAEIGEGMTQPTRLALGCELADAAGNVVGGQAAPVLLSPSAGGRLRYRQEFTVKPGVYTVKIAAADSAGHVGSLDRPIVADFVTRGPISVADLVVSDAADDGGSDLDVEPLVAGGRLVASVDLRTAPGALPKDTSATLEVVDPTGKPALTVPVQIISSSDGTRHVIRTTVDAAALAPGAFRARILVTTPGQPPIEAHRAFRVTR